MEKEKMETEGKNESQHLVFFPPIINLATLKMYKKKLKTLAFIGADKYVTEILIGEKENMTNKGNGKQEEANSLLIQVIPKICTEFQHPRCSSS